MVLIIKESTYCKAFKLLTINFGILKPKIGQLHPKPLSIILGLDLLINTELNYNCTHGLYLFLRSNCCKKLTLTLLTHKSPKYTIVSVEINNFLYKLDH